LSNPDSEFSQRKSVGVFVLSGHKKCDIDRRAPKFVMPEQKVGAHIPKM